MNGIAHLRKTVGAVVISLGTFAIMGFSSGHALADSAPADTALLSSSTTSTPADSQPSAANEATSTPTAAGEPPASAAAAESGVSSSSSQPPSASSDAALPSPADSSASQPTAPTNDSTASASTPSMASGGDSSNTATAAANTVTSTTQSGNASVDHNLTAGSATSGDAAASSLVLTSSGTSNVGGQSITTFVVTAGDTSGNIVIDPSQFTTTTTAIATASPSGVASSASTTNVNVCATSGSASVTSNGTAGNASSGNADAAADVVSLADTTVSSPQFFVGVVDVYGNLAGDILLPAAYASNPLPAASSSQGGSAASSIQIVDNLAASAQSGNASVEHNTTADNASSGRASTSVTECDVIGSQFAGSGVVLVLVNVQGQWTGLVMGGPAAPIYFLGTADTTQAVTPQSSSPSAAQTLYYNISANAQSGDALVANNGTAGSATSGNAMASIGLLHLVASQISTSHWFGVLFINVFGDWTGSLGTVAVPAAPSDPGTPGAQPTGGDLPAGGGEIRFALPQMPHSSARIITAAYRVTAPSDAAAEPSASAVLGDSTNLPDRQPISVENTQSHSLNFLWIVIGAFAVAEGVWAVGYLRDKSKENRGSAGKGKH